MDPGVAPPIRIYPAIGGVRHGSGGVRRCPLRTVCCRLLIGPYRMPPQASCSH